MKKVGEFFNNLVGNILMIFYERTWLYYLGIIGLVEIFNVLRYISIQEYKQQLEVMVASVHQLNILCADFYSLITIYLLYRFIKEGEKYRRHS